MDHLNVLTPAEARRLSRQLDVRYTPRYGRSLARAASVFAVVAKLGLDQWLLTHTALNHQIGLDERVRLSEVAFPHTLVDENMLSLLNYHDVVLCQRAQVRHTLMACAGLI